MAKKELRDFALAFTGERVQVYEPEGAPAWMGDKIWKQQVKKMGTDKMEEVLKMALIKSTDFKSHPNPTFSGTGASAGCSSNGFRHSRACSLIFHSGRGLLCCGIHTYFHPQTQCEPRREPILGPHSPSGCHLPAPGRARTPSQRACPFSYPIRPACRRGRSWPLQWLFSGPPDHLIFV